MILGLLIDHNDRESADKDTGVPLTSKSLEMMYSNKFLRDHSCNFGIAWCTFALTLCEPAKCYMHTFWEYQVLCAHFLICQVLHTQKNCGKCVHSQLSGCIWYFGVVLNLDTTAKRLPDSVRKSKKAFQQCWKALHVWCSALQIRCYKRSSSQLAQFAWQVHNWVVCFHGNNPTKFPNFQCNKFVIYKPIILKN